MAPDRPKPRFTNASPYWGFLISILEQVMIPLLLLCSKTRLGFSELLLDLWQGRVTERETLMELLQGLSQLLLNI